MKDVSRREAITKLATGGAGLVLMKVAGSQAATANEGDNNPQGQTSVSVQAPARVFRGQHQPKPLSFDPAKLKGISEKLIRSHWENNYGGAVKALNAVEQRLEVMLREKDLPAYLYGDVKREELVRSCSVVLHD
jgi:superoxide dismutase, Fe-Mn family